MLKDRAPHGRFTNPVEERGFFKSLSSRLYEYEYTTTPASIYHDAREINEAIINRIEAYLGNFSFSKSAISRALKALREDQEKVLRRSSEKVPGWHLTHEIRDQLLLKIRGLYKYESPLTTDRQIAFNLSLALARLGFEPDKAGTIQKVFQNANKAPSETPPIDEES